MIMSICEKCYKEATRRSHSDYSKTRHEHYLDILKERKDNPCTPKEQAGQYWDEELQCDIRKINNWEKEYKMKDVELEMKPDVKFYCSCCNSNQDVYPVVLSKDELNPTRWADIVCKKCNYIIATVILKEDENV